jgi:hypothetical protein
LARSPQFTDGRRNGIKACIEWLHAEAARMNDPKARDVLNSAAFSLGVEMKQPTHTPSTPSPPVS